MDSLTTSSAKIDVYQLVTDQIITVMEQGVVPWQKPWTEASVPMNMISKRQYRGINLWMLLTLNYERNFFLTWDQIKACGGSVNQGQHGHIVVFWKKVKKQPEELNGKSEPKMIAMLRYYKVFNIEQCRDIPSDLIPEVNTGIAEHDTNAACETILTSIPNGPTILHKEQKAYYHIEQDIINMPRKKSFKTLESYYGVLFHETVHWTGSSERLGRKTLTDMVPFGSESYAMEELIAEMGSAFLCRTAGILPIEIKSKAAYIQNWLEVFKKDKRFLISASGQAQKAADFILNRKDEEAKEDAEEVAGESVVS